MEKGSADPAIAIVERVDALELMEEHRRSDNGEERGTGARQPSTERGELLLDGPCRGGDEDDLPFIGDDLAGYILASPKLAGGVDDFPLLEQESVNLVQRHWCPLGVKWTWDPPD